MLGPRYRKESLDLDNSSTAAGVEGTTKYFQERGRTSRWALSDEFAHYISLVNIVGICTAVSLFEIVANAINLIVWRRQGFHETVNLTLFATSLSDMVSVLTTLWVAVCYNPLFLSAELPFLPLELQLLTGDMPHVMAMNASGWLTAYVTFERCLCIAFPFRVKDILTTFRTKVVIVSIFVMVIVLQLPMYMMNSIEWKFDAERNRTLLGLVLVEEYQFFNQVGLLMANVLGPFLSFAIVVVCTGILVVALRRKRKWRQGVMADSEKEEEMVKRDRKVMKMILAVSIVFIASNAPAVIIAILVARDSEWTPAGSLANNYYVAVSFAFVFETVNASVNIIVYYNMSSRFKDDFRSIFDF